MLGEIDRQNSGQFPWTFENKREIRYLYLKSGRSHQPGKTSPHPESPIALFRPSLDRPFATHQRPKAPWLKYQASQHPAEFSPPPALTPALR
ncbi:MAG TPA: hypothetical protein DCS91_11885 [Microcoleaceae bacterium UBA11344]|nr:hypothetical protein [Microcoleaceae cyanobacterium UBA11344]